ncbi:ubiquitin-like protein Pup [Nesterenkonia pannonica]|uniref:ubiquitin-like protein Pup n=1 Tax=Nesterenkonia pannonica TaxID=1548602 RepID=UPI00216469E7|nr:ubiquitin-like protein Pup [Nesterenkonia pannonica]
MRRPQSHGSAAEAAPASRRRQRPADGGLRPGARKPQAAERVDELDSLLDEIDTVLESNAEEFVKGFVQKGGQ